MTASNREMLERAARAAGIGLLRSRLDDPMWRDYLLAERNPAHPGEGQGWNPLTDDGDALRLAVKLGIDIRRSLEGDLVSGLSDTATATEERHPDPYAATRRAIVRAAAAMWRGEAMPERIQLSRAKGWKMPPNTVKVTRPGKWGNPFRVGGYFMLGEPDAARVHPAFRMAWCESSSPDPRFAKITDNAMAVDFFRRLMASGYHKDLSALRGKNLACWCKPDAECHADVLLELANEPGGSE